MKALKLIRLTSIIAAMGIIAAYTIKYINEGESQLFNWILLIACLILVPLLIITELKKEINPKYFLKYGKNRRNVVLGICIIFLAIGLFEMIAFDKGWQGLPYILIIVYFATSSLIRYKIRQKYLEDQAE